MESPECEGGLISCGLINFYAGDLYAGEGVYSRHFTVSCGKQAFLAINIKKKNLQKKDTFPG